MIELDNLKKALEADGWCQECGQEHIRPAVEQLIKAFEQPANGIELEWYCKGWDDAEKDLATQEKFME